MNPPEDLNLYNEFLRRISRRLIFDEHVADDLCQDAWVALLEKMPATQFSLRAWLAGTVRNLSRMFYRTERRRRDREYQYASMEPENIEEYPLEDEEIRNLVNETLDALKEPLRTTLLLRYYKDMSYKEIASSMDVPLGTMKTRLKQGIDQMRKRLDAQHNGDRKRWTAALLPILGIPASRLQSLTRNKTKAKSGLHEKIRMSPFPTTVMGAIVFTLTIWLFIHMFSFSSQEQENPESTLPVAEVSEVVQEIIDEVKEVGLEKQQIAPDPNEVISNDPKTVAWNGTLIDHTGRPLKDALLKLESYEFKSYDEEISSYQTHCDSNGKFHLSGLTPGVYTLLLSFPQVQYHAASEANMLDDTFVRWGKMTISENPINKHDIRILSEENAVLSGYVLDEGTGFPIDKEGVKLFIYNHPMCNAYYQTEVCSDGSFCFRCLPGNSRYDLKVKGPGGYNQTYISHFNLAAGEVRDDVKLFIPPLGELKIVLSGFTNEEREGMQLSCLPATSEVTRIPDPGEEILLCFEKGPVNIRVDHEELGHYSAKVQISKNSIEELVIQKSVLSTTPVRTVSFQCRIRDSEGEPIINKMFTMYSQIATPKGGGSVYKGRTDEAGYIAIDAAEPGKYGLQVVVFDEKYEERFKELRWWAQKDFPITIYSFHDLEIPETDPCVIEKKLPAGTIIGRVIDRITGEPIHEGVPRWTVSVKTAHRGCKFVTYQICPEEGNRFRMEGIPAGDNYFLGIDAPNYFEHHIGPLKLAEGETLDLGLLEMEPSGVVDIVVRNPDGEAIRRFDVFCDDMFLGQNGGLKRMTIENPVLTKRFSALPIKPLTMRVHAEGYVDELFEVTPHPGVPAHVEILLCPISE